MASHGRRGVSAMVLGRPSLGSGGAAAGRSVPMAVVRDRETWVFSFDLLVADNRLPARAVGDDGSDGDLTAKDRE
jgi:hypothetical protein